MTSAEFPKDAARRLASTPLSEGFRPDGLFAWTDKNGAPVFYRVRLKHPITKEKWIRPMYFNGTHYSLGEPKFTDKKPMYGLHLILGNTTDDIWIVEGENKVNALRSKGLLATTSGAANSAHSVNWAPLTNRRIIVWRDNDEAGLRYANEVTKILQDLNCEISWVDVGQLNLPAKGDCVDWFGSNPTASKANLLSLPRIEMRLTAIPGLESSSDLNVVDLYDLLKLEIPVREKILPWMPAQSLCMIHAWRGVGKTHVALGISYAIATGTSFLNWTALTRRKVLYVDGEMPASAIQERLARIVASSEQEAVPGQLRIITPDLQDGGLPDLATDEGQELVDQIVRDSEVIVIDNLSCLVRGSGKENDAESWLRMQQWALKHRSKGRSILFIHHSGKNGNQRGTSKKEDLLDTVIRLKHSSDYEHADGAVFEVHFEKARHLHGEELNPFVAQLVDRDGKQIWETTPLEETTYDQVVKLANEGLIPNDIAQEMEVDKSTVSRHLKRARAEGLVSQQPNARRFNRQNKLTELDGRY